MNIKRSKKKKGFTLIELVIVLAVLAIIALIAIPNFTKVRNDSMEKADLRAAEQIEKITLMAIANENIIPPTTNKTDYTLTFSNKKFVGYKKGTVATVVNNDDYAQMLDKVKAPQVDSTTNTTYFVEVGSTGKVAVKYNTNGKILSGTTVTE